MNTGAPRSAGPAAGAPASTPVGGAADPDVAVEIRTAGAHVAVRRVGRHATPKPRPRDRTLCARTLDRAPAMAVCLRCRLGLNRLLAHLMKRAGRDLAVTVDGQPWPMWVARAIAPPLLSRAIATTDEPGPPSGHRWATMAVSGSRRTHLGVTRATIRDPGWQRVWTAEDPAPRTTACLRPGHLDDGADPHPDRLCPACAAARERLLAAAADPRWADQQTPDDPASAARPAAGQPVTDLLADAARLVVVGQLRSVGGGHAAMPEMLRVDATMTAVWPAARVAALTPGRPTLCGAAPGERPQNLTPLGGCRSCASAASRVGTAVRRHWPRARGAVEVDGAVVPASVLGGARARLVDPVLLAHIVFDGPGERQPDRVDDCASTADDRIHLGWRQRVEGRPLTGWWRATLPHPRRTLCGAPAAADAPPGAEPCAACAEEALSKRSRYGRHAPDPRAPLLIAGTTYDPALSELMGRAFAVAMLADDLRRRGAKE